MHALTRLSAAVTGLILAVALSCGARAEPVRAAHLTAELVSESRTIAPGGSVRAALRQSMDPGWHTYWRNPGDSGQPTALTFDLPPGWSAEPLAWPTPQRLPIGPLMDYGYTGETLMPFTVRAPADARPGDRLTLTATADFLVCKDVCVPAQAHLRLPLTIAAVRLDDPAWAGRIRAADAALPRGGVLRAVFGAGPGGVRLSVTGPPAVRPRSVFFFPYATDVIDHARPEPAELGPRGLTLTLSPGQAFRAPSPPSVLDGVIVLDGRGYEISARRGPAPPGVSGLGPLGEAGGGLAAFAIATGSALLGGLILNLMPCVFPVLSMKIAALARHAHDPVGARRQAFAYAGGAVGAFTGLAGLLLAARRAGEAVGWGFQLQSPLVVEALSALMLLVALNLSGVFEVGARIQGLAAAAGAPRGRSGGESLAGSALTGALAVAVAAPCTAPFMAGAIGFALVQPPAEALAVFAALGLGMSAPFVLIAAAPGLADRIPRPGPWMETLRRLLAFPMFGAAAWLLWVLAVRGEPGRLAAFLAALVLLAFAAFLLGEAQRAGASGRRAPIRRVAALAAVALAIAAAVRAPAPPLSPAAYSSESLAALRAEGRPVFVNFTAAWCVTCQVNERLALSRPAVAEAFRRDRVAYLVADWTRRDPAIAGALADHGRAGVPLYLMYGAGAGEAEILPQVLTESELVRAADRAAGGPG